MIPGTVQLTGVVAPTSTTDTYPVIDPKYGIDGLRNVANDAERDAIPSDRRREGMIVGVNSSGLYYKLVAGPWSLTSADWVEINMGVSALAFKTIRVATQSDIIASSATDILEVEAGSNITITTDPSSKKLIINADIASGSSLQYPQADLSTVSINNIPAGTDLSGYYLWELLKNIYAPFISPVFTSFSMSGQNTTVEVGDTLTGLKSFTFGFSNSNVLANTLDIIDVTNSNTALVTDQPITSPINNVNIGSVSYNTLITHTWKATATDSENNDFSSSNFNISWKFKKYYGTSTNTVLSAAQIQALATGTLSSTTPGSYSFAAGGYKYICLPESSPNPSTIKDAATNLDVVMVTSNDDINYNQFGNYYYMLVSVTNSNGVTSNYKVFRTLNTLGGAIIFNIT